MTLLMTFQLCCTFGLVVESLNAPIYVAACLTPVYGAQLAFTRANRLAFTLVSSTSFYILYLSLYAPSLSINDLLSVMLVIAGVAISIFLGAIRIRALDQEFFARQELARKSAALARAEEQARSLADEAHAASRAKSTFLANMSHELRTPLNAIIGYSELLHELSEDDGFTHIQPDLDRISRSASHLLNLINEILDLSKIEAGRMDLVAADLSLDDLLRELRDMAAPLAAKHHNTLVITPPSRPISLRTDRLKLRQILLNLLSNAAKFTDHGTISLRCDDTTQDHLKLIVSDTGIGMSPQQLSRLFQSFVQVHDPSSAERYGGTGLGLVLCKRFASLLGGELHVQSAPGQGTSFTLILPLSPHLDAPAPQ